MSDTQSHDEFFNKHMEFLNRVLQLKAKMLEKKLERAKAYCKVDGCQGLIWAHISPYNKHIHAQCDACKRIIME